MTSILTHGPDTLAVASAPPPDAVMFDDGSYLILYSVEDPDDGTTHYYAQHYTSDGETLGDPILTDGDYPWESTRGQVA
ncbi:MAG: hypothetical protein JF615_12030, partial [Asticcacaulis sp.]|nr:hypothetical protein [Asticcacaulis sp.]